MKRNHFFRRVSIAYDYVDANTVVKAEKFFTSDNIVAVAMLSFVSNVRVYFARNSIEAKIIKDKMDLRRRKVIFLGIGGRYQPDQLLFDWEDRNQVPFYQNGIAKASAGVIWDQYSSQILLECGCPREKVETVSDFIRYDFVMEVDRKKGGGTDEEKNERIDGLGLSFATAIERFNANKDQKQAFIEAVYFSQLLLTHEIAFAVDFINQQNINQ